jgi:hypothetical protein
LTATVKFVSTTSSKLPQLNIENGQLIFVSDTRTICLDFNGARTEYNQIVVLFNENQRLSLTTPIEGLFYFVKETNILWRYDGNYQWVQLTSPPKENIVFLDYKDLPQQGKEKVLYITEKTTYQWKNDAYIELGALTWETF